LNAEDCSESKPEDDDDFAHNIEAALGTYEV
jgi:hypothetical protein